MATFSLAKPTFAKLVGITSVPMEHCAAGATAQQASQFIKSPADAAVPVASGANTAILGLALNARVATGDDLTYIKAMPGVLFEFSLESSGSPGLALLASHLGNQYGLVVASNIAYIDVDDTSTKLVTIKELVSSVGDIRGRVLAEFIPASYAAQS
jgi:hypothetical protein